MLLGAEVAPVFLKLGDAQAGGLLPSPAVKAENQPL